MEALGLPDHELVISHPFFGVNGKNQNNAIISIAYLFEHRPSFTHFGVFEIHGNRSHRRLLRRRRRFRRTRRLPASPFSLLVLGLVEKEKGPLESDPFWLDFCPHEEWPPSGAATACAVTAWWYRPPDVLRVRS